MDIDRNAPATKGDLIDAVAQIRGEMGEGFAQIRGEIGDSVAQLRSEMSHQYDDLRETLRDNETKLLKAFYSFAETNQQRLTATERDAAAMKDRLAMVETRLTEVEKRLNMPPAI